MCQNDFKSSLWNKKTSLTQIGIQTFFINPLTAAYTDGNNTELMSPAMLDELISEK